LRSPVNDEDTGATASTLGATQRGELRLQSGNRFLLSFRQRVQPLDCRERDAVRVLQPDRFVAVTYAERDPKVLRCRTDVPDRRIRSVLGLPSIDRHRGQFLQHRFTVEATQVALQVSIARARPAGATLRVAAPGWEPTARVDSGHEPDAPDARRAHVERVLALPRRA